MGQMKRTLFANLAMCLLVSVGSPAGAIDLNTSGTMATELEPARTCTLNEAHQIIEDNDIKYVLTLPQTVNAMRFLGYSRQTGDLVGASVAVLGCGLTMVTDIGRKRPWCEYLPFKAERCPTSFLRK